MIVNVTHPELPPPPKPNGVALTLTMYEAGCLLRVLRQCPEHDIHSVVGEELARQLERNGVVKDY